MFIFCINILCFFLYYYSLRLISGEPDTISVLKTYFIKMYFKFGIHVSDPKLNKRAVSILTLSYRMCKTISHRNYLYERIFSKDLLKTPYCSYSKSGISDLSLCLKKSTIHKTNIYHRYQPTVFSR